VETNGDVLYSTLANIGAGVVQLITSILLDRGLTVTPWGVGDGFGDGGGGGSGVGEGCLILLYEQSERCILSVV